MNNIVGLLRDLSQYLGSTLASYTSDHGITIYFQASSFSDVTTTDTVIVDGLNALCRENRFMIETDYWDEGNQARKLAIDVNDDIFNVEVLYTLCEHDIVQATVKTTITPKYVAYFLDTMYKPI